MNRGQAFGTKRAMESLKRDGFIEEDGTLTPLGRSALAARKAEIERDREQARALIARLKEVTSEEEGRDLLTAENRREVLREAALRSNVHYESGDSAETLRDRILNEIVARRLRQDAKLRDQQPLIDTLQARATGAPPGTLVATMTARGFPYRLVVGDDGQLRTEARLSGRWTNTGGPYATVTDAMRAWVDDNPHWVLGEGMAQPNVEYEEATSLSQLQDFGRARGTDIPLIPGHRNPKEYRNEFLKEISSLDNVDENDPTALRAAAKRFRDRAEGIMGVSSMRIGSNRPGKPGRSEFHYQYGIAGEDAALQMRSVADALDRLATDREGGTPARMPEPTPPTPEPPAQTPATPGRRVRVRAPETPAAPPRQPSDAAIVKRDLARMDTRAEGERYLEGLNLKVDELKELQKGLGHSAVGRSKRSIIEAIVGVEVGGRADSKAISKAMAEARRPVVKRAATTTARTVKPVAGDDPTLTLDDLNLNEADRAEYESLEPEWRRQHYLAQVNAGMSPGAAYEAARVADKSDARQPIHLSSLSPAQRQEVMALTPEQRADYFIRRNSGSSHENALAGAKGTRQPMTMPSRRS
jgi:hypothetical protein